MQAYNPFFYPTPPSFSPHSDILSLSPCGQTLPMSQQGEFDEISDFFNEDLDLIKDKGDNKNEEWLQIHPSIWNENQVLDFLYAVLKESEFALDSFNGEAYSRINGTTLMNMSLEQHLKCSPRMGEFIYCFCQDLRQKSCFKPPSEIYTKPYQPVIPTIVEKLSLDMECEFLDSSQTIPLCSEITALEPLIPNTFDLFTPQSHQTSFDLTPPYNFSNQWLDEPFVSSQTFTELKPRNAAFEYSYNNVIENILNFNKTNIAFNNSWNDDINQKNFKPNNVTVNKPITKQKRGRPRKRKSSSDDEDLYGSKTHVTLSKKKLLWEFMCDLLKNGGTGEVLEKNKHSVFAKSSPIKKSKIVEWEDKEEGVFRILDARQVSHLWGLHKSRDNMSFEKLTRALRWCKNESKTMDVLPENKSYPKRCFRFGSKAYNWKELATP